MHVMLVMLLWRAGAEQEGEEEEGHFKTPTLRLGSLLHCLFVLWLGLGCR
jgi:hypothetical protein